MRMTKIKTFANLPTPTVLSIGHFVQCQFFAGAFTLWPAQKAPQVAATSTRLYKGSQNTFFSGNLP